MTNPPPVSAELAGNPYADPTNLISGDGTGVVFLDHDKPMILIEQMPLPGIVIFVHGVNSDGEWYTPCEKGLCDGLNARLRRRQGEIVHASPDGGQLKPAAYLPELTDDGFINPDMTDKTFIKADPNFSPVIQFRWGYKACGPDLKAYGPGLYLNEEDYWGGGPFANGCTSLPDLWGEGLSDSLFLWLHVQHLNPTNDRNVYACPPRPYYVLAALRLAELVESIRKKQADVPITIVCHSQGNMIGMAAAFLGDRLAPAKDGAGKSGRCVADNYVLCNAPYSLVKKNLTQGWAERAMKDGKGSGGRQTYEARCKTLAAFFDIIRKQAPMEQSAEHIDELMKNEAHGFNAKSDRKEHGFGATLATYGRVTLYFNPHDHVISASTVQGIGWRGLSQLEIDDTKGEDVFSQRVFAQNILVGQKKGQYDFWANHYGIEGGIKPGSQSFWFPQSQMAKYSIKKGLDTNERVIGKVMTLVTAPLAIFGMLVARVRINALPPDDWKTPLVAPKLPEEFVPEALRFGISSKDFDQGSDAPGESRDKDRRRSADDPYAGDNPIPKGGTEAARKKGSDAAEGDKSSEAALRYEHHAYLRFQAKRDGRYAPDAKVTEEDTPGSASADYNAWRTKMIKENLSANVTTHATDHSTIMTNNLHAEKALAYDVAIGRCHISKEDMHKLRMAADWRFLKGLRIEDPHTAFNEYFKTGFYKKMTVFDWATKTDEGSMPEKIIDMRAIGAGIAEAVQ
jgi:pimeloyl-ACP methyl ester carboxylesterase